MSTSLAAELLRDGRPAAASRAAERSLALSPDDAPAWGVLGAAMLQTGGNTAAVTAILRAWRSDPGKPLLLLNLGVALNAGSRRAEAAAVFRKLTTIAPDSALAESWCGACLQTQGDLRRAGVRLRRALILNPSGERDYINLHAVRIEDGRPEKAAVAACAGLIAGPDSPELWLRLAGALLVAGAPEDAVIAAGRAYRLSPSHDARRTATRSRRYAQARSWRTNADGPGDGLVIRGQFAGYSGYAHMTARFVTELTAQGTPLNLIGLTGDESAAPSAAVDAACAISFTTPLTFEPIPGLRNVLFSMFEGTEIPLGWARISDTADLVIVPTRSSQDAWIAGGADPRRLRICPLGVDPAKTEAGPLQIRTADGASANRRRFRFLNIADLTARKNLDGLLRAWIRATDKNDDAVLILKPGKGGTEAMQATAAAVRQAETATGRLISEAAPMVVVTTTLSDSSMTALTLAATHYLSMSCGEGWDLPLTQAAALGLEVIAPRHSSYLDYLADDDAHMLPCRVEPADGNAAPTFRECGWWRPDENAAVATIRAIIDGCATPRRPLAARLSRDYSWRRAAERLTGVLRAEKMLR
jgi:tetratricopeptide (TPR) repeat protein/glycosyltransferase involved in cell wall biosynthesis